MGPIHGSSIPPRPPGAVPAIILAAGKGTRMKAGAPKAAVHLNGEPMVTRVIRAVREAGASPVIVVVGHGAETVRAAIGDGVEYVVQEEQWGTGHAVRCAASTLEGYAGPVIVTYADVPLLPDHEVVRLLEEHRQHQTAATLLTARVPQPGTLGRIVRAPDGRVAAIVEARDASEEQLRIDEVNVGVYCFTAPLLFQVLAQVRNDNAQGQYYLTDVIGILVDRGALVRAVTLRRPEAGLGVDTLEDLRRAEQVLNGSGG